MVRPGERAARVGSGVRECPLLAGALKEPLHKPRSISRSAARACLLHASCIVILRVDGGREESWHWSAVVLTSGGKAGASWSGQTEQNEGRRETMAREFDLGGLWSGEIRT